MIPALLDDAAMSTILSRTLLSAQMTKFPTTFSAICQPTQDMYAQEMLARSVSLKWCIPLLPVLTVFLLNCKPYTFLIDPRIYWLLFTINTFLNHFCPTLLSFNQFCPYCCILYPHLPFSSFVVTHSVLNVTLTPSVPTFLLC